MSASVRKLTPPGATPTCDPRMAASCMGRMTALEKSVRSLQQSNLELAETVREAIAESHRRSEALDGLARRLLASDSGLQLLKTSSGDLPVVVEDKTK